MVQTKKMVLEVEIEIDVPVDIVQDKGRIKAVEDGIGRSISEPVRSGSLVPGKEDRRQDQMTAPDGAVAIIDS